MKKTTRLVRFYLSVLAMVLSFGASPSSSQAGVLCAVEGAVLTIEGFGDDVVTGFAALGVTAVIGGGLIWGGASLMNSTSPGSVGKVIGIVLLVLKNRSLDEFRRLVDVRYDFIQNTEIRHALALEIQKAHVAAGAPDRAMVSVDAGILTQLASAGGLTADQTSILLEDLK